MPCLVTIIYYLITIYVSEVSCIGKMQKVISDKNINKYNNNNTPKKTISLTMEGSHIYIRVFSGLGI